MREKHLRSDTNFSNTYSKYQKTCMYAGIIKAKLQAEPGRLTRVIIYLFTLSSIAHTISRNLHNNVGTIKGSISLLKKQRSICRLRLVSSDYKGIVTRP